MIGQIGSYLWRSYRLYTVAQQFERDTVVQLVIVCSMPILLIQLPAVARYVVPPLCVFLAGLMIHKQMQYQAESALLKKINDENEGAIKALMESVVALEMVIREAGKINGAAVDANKTQVAVCEQLEDGDKKLNERLVQHKERVEALAKLCQDATNTKLMERMHALDELNLQCTQRSGEIQKLNQEFALLMEDIRIALKDYGDNRALLKEKIEILERRLKERGLSCL